MLFIPIQRGEGIGTRAGRACVAPMGVNGTALPRGLGGGRRGSPCHGAAGEGKERGGKGLLTASCHYLARAVGRAAQAEEAMELEQVEGGRDAAGGSRGRGGPRCLPTEVAGQRRGAPEPRLPTAASVSGSVGAAGSSSPCSGRGRGMPQRRACIPGSPTEGGGCFALLHFTARASSPVVPASFQQEQGQTAIPDLRPLLVEPRPPLPGSLGPRVWCQVGLAALAGLPAALLPCLLAPAHQPAVSAREDPVSQRRRRAATCGPDPCRGACCSP